MSLNNKIVLVTGADTDVGAAIVLKYSKNGAKVAIVGKNEDKLKNISESCEEAGNKPLVIVADVSNEDDASRIINETLKCFQKLDVLVNNVGIGIQVSIIDDCAIQMFDQVMTHLRACVNLTHLASKHLIETKGNIINISTMTTPNELSTESFAYSTAKAALDHFTTAVAYELVSKGVSVNTICLGPVEADIIVNLANYDEYQEEVWKQWKKATSLKKISKPEEIANLAVSLASDSDFGVTGVSLVADNCDVYSRLNKQFRNECNLI